jgi:RNA polymerase sigma-B factor
VSVHHETARRLTAWSQLSEQELWEATGHGESGAREELARRYHPLAQRLAAGYRRGGEPQEDLVQVASLGLWQAIGRFDPNHGTAFRSFAIPTILGELKRYFRDTGWIAHVPRGAQELALTVQKTADAMTERTGRTPSIVEIAESLNRDVEDVVHALITSNAHFGSSLDAPSADRDEAPALIDTVGSVDDGYALVDARHDLSDALRRLPFQERRVVQLRAQEGLKQSEIAARIGCSQMQVSRLLRRAIQRLKV